MKMAKCPVCGQLHDRHYRVDDVGQDRPEPGDLTVCSNCESPLRFTDKGLEKLDLTTLDEIEAALISAVQRKLRLVKRHIKDMGN